MSQVMLKASLIKKKLKSGFNFQKKKESYKKEKIVIDPEFFYEDYTVVEYINETNRGFSQLNQKVQEIVEKNPVLNIFDITRKMSVDMLNQVEMCNQEAAWFLLRQPMCKSSVSIIYISTVWPEERKRMKKAKKELDQLAGESTEIWKENIFDKYEKRHKDLEDVCLADFVAKYSINKQNKHSLRKKNVSFDIVTMTN